MTKMATMPIYGNIFSLESKGRYRDLKGKFSKNPYFESLHEHLRAHKIVPYLSLSFLYFLDFIHCFHVQFIYFVYTKVK